MLKFWKTIFKGNYKFKGLEFFIVCAVFHLARLSNVISLYSLQMHNSEFNSLAALAELYGYAFKYSDQLMLTLEEDEFSTKNRLAYRLEQVHSIMTTDQD